MPRTKFAASLAHSMSCTYAMQNLFRSPSNRLSLDRPRRKTKIGTMWKVVRKFSRKVVGKETVVEHTTRRLRFRTNGLNEIYYIPSRAEYHNEDIENLWWCQDDYEFFKEANMNEANEPYSNFSSASISTLNPTHIRTDSFGRPAHSPVYFCKSPGGLTQYQVYTDSSWRNPYSVKAATPHHGSASHLNWADSIDEYCSDSSSNSSGMDDDDSSFCDEGQYPEWFERLMSESAENVSSIYQVKRSSYCGNHSPTPDITLAMSDMDSVTITSLPSIV